MDKVMLTCMKCKKKRPLDAMCHLWGKTLCPRCVSKKLIGC